MQILGPGYGSVVEQLPRTQRKAGRCGSVVESLPRTHLGGTWGHGSTMENLLSMHKTQGPYPTSSTSKPTPEP